MKSIWKIAHTVGKEGSEGYLCLPPYNLIPGIQAGSGYLTRPGANFSFLQIPKQAGVKAFAGWCFNFEIHGRKAVFQGREHLSVHPFLPYFWEVENHPEAESIFLDDEGSPRAVHLAYRELFQGADVCLTDNWLQIFFPHYNTEFTAPGAEDRLQTLALETAECLRLRGYLSAITSVCQAQGYPLRIIGTALASDLYDNPHHLAQKDFQFLIYTVAAGTDENSWSEYPKFSLNDIWRLFWQASQREGKNLEIRFAGYPEKIFLSSANPEVNSLIMGREDGGEDLQRIISHLAAAGPRSFGGFFQVLERPDLFGVVFSPYWKP